MLPIVFDLDGTLVDSLPGIAKAANAVLAEDKLPPLSNDVVARFVGLGEEVFVDRLIATTDLRPENRAAIMQRFISHYLKVGKETPLFAGVGGVLRQLRAMNVKTGLCTNKPRGPLVPVLEATDLNAMLDIVLAGDDLPKRKPNPEPLLHVANQLGASQVIYVGDTSIDAETASRAGMPFVLFTEGIRVEPISEIPHQAAFSDFSELISICEGLSATIEAVI